MSDVLQPMVKHAWWDASCECYRLEPSHVLEHVPGVRRCTTGIANDRSTAESWGYKIVTCSSAAQEEQQ